MFNLSEIQINSVLQYFDDIFRLNCFKIVIDDLSIFSSSFRTGKGSKRENESQLIHSEEYGVEHGGKEAKRKKREKNLKGHL